MKQGKSLTELAVEIERQSHAKNDYLAESGRITMSPDDNKLKLDNGKGFEIDGLKPNDNAHMQMAAWSGIGTRYYRRMLEDSPALLAGNVNHWLHHPDNRDKRRMVRELDGNARAFLSDRYLRLDNDVTMQTALAALQQVDNVEVKSCDVTNDKLYIKAVFPKTEMEVKLNDPVQCGVVITNSEIGKGSFEVKALVYRLVCLNGMVSGQVSDTLRRRHLGSRVTHDNIVYSQKTIELNAEATLSECRDAIATFSNPDYFADCVAKMADAAESVSARNPEKAVEKLAKTFTFNETERSAVLERFIREQDYTQYGALNAVTNLANDVESYDRASELERIGGQILELNPNQWETIALAA